MHSPQAEKAAKSVQRSGYGPDGPRIEPRQEYDVLIFSNTIYTGYEAQLSQIKLVRGSFSEAKAAEAWDWPPRHEGV